MLGSLYSDDDDDDDTPKTILKRIRRSGGKDRYSYEMEKESDTFADCSLKHFEEGTHSDVTLIVGEKREEIKAHKYVLSSRSEVFRAMFSGNYKENDGRVEIPDIQPNILTTLLRYMYSGRCEDPTGDTVISLSYAAEKYAINGFARECEWYIQSNVSLDRFCTILNMAVMLNKTCLRDECLHQTSVIGSRILQNDHFNSLSIDALQTLLEYDLFNAPEESIFDACIMWAEHQCEENEKDKSSVKVREYIQPVLKLIRFASMKLETFSSEVSTRDILTAEEKVALFQMFVNKTEEYKKFEFSSAPPRSEANKFALLKEDGDLSEMVGCEDFIELCFSEDNCLVAFDAFLPDKEEGSSEKYTGKVEICIRDDRDEIFHSQTDTLQQTYSDFHTFVLRPCRTLYEDREYILSISFEDDLDYIIMKGREGVGNKVVSDDVELRLRKGTVIDRRTLRLGIFENAYTCFDSIYTLSDR